MSSSLARRLRAKAVKARMKGEVQKKQSTEKTVEVSRSWVAEADRAAGGYLAVDAVDVVVLAPPVPLIVFIGDAADDDGDVDDIASHPDILAKHAEVLQKFLNYARTYIEDVAELFQECLEDSASGGLPLVQPGGDGFIEFEIEQFWLL